MLRPATPPALILTWVVAVGSLEVSPSEGPVRYCSDLLTHPGTCRRAHESASRRCTDVSTHKLSLAGCTTPCHSPVSHPRDQAHDPERLARSSALTSEWWERCTPSRASAILLRLREAFKLNRLWNFDRSELLRRAAQRLLFGCEDGPETVQMVQTVKELFFMSEDLRVWTRRRQKLSKFDRSNEHPQK